MTKQKYNSTHYDWRNRKWYEMKLCMKNPKLSKQYFSPILQSSLHSHIHSNHLSEICRRLGPLVDKEVPNNVRGVQSLLGAGRQSILRSKGGTHGIWSVCKHCLDVFIILFIDLVRKLNHERYVIRQNQQPRCIPLDLTAQLNTGKHCLIRLFLEGY